MTIYVKIPKVDLASFKPAYLALVGETIQSQPLENTEETHYLVGSSRVTQAQIDSLVNDYPDVSYTSDNYPQGWVTKGEEL